MSAVAVFLILALDLAGYQWLEWGIMAFVGVIGLCYGFEIFLVHPDWQQAAFRTLVPSLDPKEFHCEPVCCRGNAGRDGDAACDLSALGAGAAAA